MAIESVEVSVGLKKRNNNTKSNGEKLQCCASSSRTTNTVLCEARDTPCGTHVRKEEEGAKATKIPPNTPPATQAAAANPAAGAGVPHLQIIHLTWMPWLLLFTAEMYIPCVVVIARLYLD